MEKMNIISTTIEYKGAPVKIIDGKIFLMSFGTTIHNRAMHWFWVEVEIDDLKSELRNLLKERGLI